MLELVTDPAVIARLPKAPLLSVEWGPPSTFRVPFVFGNRFANAFGLSIGRLRLTWRRPWLLGPAQANHPHLFAGSSGASHE